MVVVRPPTCVVLSLATLSASRLVVADGVELGGGETLNLRRGQRPDLRRRQIVEHRRAQRADLRRGQRAGLRRRQVCSSVEVSVPICAVVSARDLGRGQAPTCVVVRLPNAVVVSPPTCVVRQLGDGERIKVGGRRGRSAGSSSGPDLRGGQRRDLRRRSGC